MRAKDIKIEFKTSQGYKVMLVHLPKRMHVLSTTVRNGAFTVADTIMMVQVPISYNGNDPEGELENIVKELGLNEHTVGFMTAADMERVITVVEQEYHDERAVAIVTAGVKNCVYAGELIPDHIQAQLGGGMAHTINTMVVLARPLHDTGMVNAVITATEAKSAALKDCAVRGTGTTSDAVAIICPIGDGEKYAGTATDIGICLSRAVRQAVKESTLKWYQRPPAIDFIAQLDDLGITVDNMWEAAKKLVFPNEQWSDEFLKQKFVDRLNILRQDVNVNALISGAIMLEDRGYRNELYGLDNDRFKADPVHLLADEVLGIGLAEYITGTKGLFEYIRYDKKKPGILADLGPFMDDIIASLIGSIMSVIYSELLEGEGSLQ
ncbi:MAG: Adenosylcobinamide amidohydrolase [Methanomassiliicoccales archaeon PtaU1.Bin124]|nr:MAG: Adenosylcobinamide amidohydrolase [Methanomassiliicoccales archaeon PtaU1.Bin124]